MTISRRNPISALVFTTLLVISGCGKNLTAAEHVSKAKDYMDKGEAKSALLELSSAVQQDPNSVEGRWLLAKVAVDMGEAPRAEKEIRKAMELGLSRASGELILVKALLLQGDFDRLLQESSTLPPNISKSDQAAILGLRGQAYIGKGQLDLAQQTLDQAVQIEPASLPALLGMTMLSGSKRQYDVARQWVEKALKVDPASPDAWSVLGDLENAQGHLTEAEKAFDQAVKHRAIPYFEQLKRAQVRIQLKKYQEAAADIKTLRDAGLKNHPYVNYVAGLNDFAQKRYQKALAAFEASYAANPDYLPNRIYLATTQLQLGNTEQALKQAQQIASIVPGSTRAQGLLGSVLISRSEYDGAKDALRILLAKSPDDPQALGMMATVSLREGNTAKGLEYAKKLAALEPDSKQAQDMLMVAKLMAGEALDNTILTAGANAAATGDVYTRDLMAALADFRDGKLKQALESAKTLQARYPDKVDPLKLIAAVYLAAGQWDEGKTELRKVLKLQANEPSALRNLAKIEAIQGNFKLAKELIQPLVKQQPGDIEAVQILAGVETRLGNPAGALVVLEQASKSKPDDLNLLEALAQTRLKLGHIAQVLEMTSGLTDAQFRQQPVLLELRGKTQLLTGNNIDAAVSFEKLTRLIPNSASAQFFYANALAGRGDAARARKALSQAVKLDPRYLPARVGEIKMHVQNKELDTARKALAKLRQDFGNRVEVLGIEGWFALGTGDFSTAEQKFAAAFKQRPDSELLLLITHAQWAQKKQEPALKAMRDWLKDHPKDVSVQMSLGDAYMNIGKDAEATAVYEQLIKLVPDNVPALNNLAWLNRDREPKRAMDFALQAHQLAPKDAIVLDTLGMLTLKNGDLGRAVSLLREAVARAPDDSRTKVHLATGLIRQGHTAEAQKILEAIKKGNAASSPAAQEASKLLDTLAKH